MYIPLPPTVFDNVVAIVIMYLYDYGFRPVGRALGVKDRKKRSPSPNPVLEAAFQCGRSEADFRSLCSDTGMSDRQIHVWMRMRNLAGK